MLVSEYLTAAQTSLQTGFSAVPVVRVINDEVSELVAPLLVLRAAEFGPAQGQDQMLVTFELDLYWAGDQAAEMAAQVYAWAYRKMSHFRLGPVAATAVGYSPEQGATRYTFSWDIVLPNDYRFDPITIDGVPIRELSLDLNGREGELVID